jgi:MFS family permease
MLKKIGPSKWIPIVMITWGMVMCAMAAVTSSTGLLIARFFLGVTEAGLFPGTIFYLSLWYTRYKLRLILIRLIIFYTQSN